MDIDWSKAPEGCTHKHKTQNDGGGIWEIWRDGDVYHWLGGDWHYYKKQNYCADWERVPRPTKPASPEWDGDGLPPVGCECEGDADTRPGGYEKCLVVYHDECAGALEHSTLALFRQKGSQKFTDPEWCSDFRPLRTKKQRERDEIIGVMLDGVSAAEFATCEWNEHANRVIEQAADAILSKYNLEPKQ